MANPARILVFVVAYHAERHVRNLFDRVPPEWISNPEIDFLVIDDASSDRGAEAVREWANQNGAENITVLRNPVNQGYGGNQKLGYRIALEGGYDFVILLHGDGQYAPELLPAFIEAWRRTGADVVLGSRLKMPGGPRRGGMPLYKLVGNRILTAVQNALTGLNLAEYHTGYRGYSTAFLRRAPFEMNTNDFHFDTEILLQAAHLGARIEEFPIPTRYGDEVCYVNGLRYAFNVLTATLRYKSHQMGVLCDLKYRSLEPTRYRDRTHRRYSAQRTALQIVRDAAPRRVLDIGCGPGYVARECEQMGVEVTGADVREPLPEMMSRFQKINPAESTLPIDPFQYDMILMLDWIEHLDEPEQFLVGLRNSGEGIGSDGRTPLVVLSTPNVAFVFLRLNLLFGRFTYADRGILEITHKRLFTRKGLVRTLRDCGYVVESVRGVPVPFQAVFESRWGAILERLWAPLAWIWPSLFSFQTLVTCRPLPGAKQLLKQAQRVRVGERLKLENEIPAATQVSSLQQR